MPLLFPFRRMPCLGWRAVLSAGVVLSTALTPAVAFSAEAAGDGALEGVIRDQHDNDVIAGATVRLLDPADGEVVDQATTGSGGRYSVTAPAGIYDLDVTGGPTNSRFVAKVRRVEVGPASRLNVTVTRLVRFSGRVRDAAGAPLPGIAVSTGGGSVTTGADGTFELIGPAGTHWVQLSRSFDQWGVHRVALLVSDVDLSKDRAAELTFPIGSTTVIVRDQHGRPVPGATASLTTNETCPDGCPVDFAVMPGATDVTSWSNVAGVTGSDGEVRLPTLPTGNLTLSAWAPEDAGLGILRRAGLSVPSVRPVEAVLRPTVTLRGRLTAGYGEGVHEGTVTLENDEYRSTETQFGTDGSFVVTAPPGRYRLHITADLGTYEERQGMESWAFATGVFVTLPEFDLTGDRTQDLHLPTKAHTIRVVDHAGNAIPGTVSGCSGSTGDGGCRRPQGPFEPAGSAAVELFPGGVGTGLLLNNGWLRENGAPDVWTVFTGAPLSVSANSGLLRRTVTVAAAGTSTEVRMPATILVTGTAGDQRGAFDRNGPSADAIITVDGSDYGAWTGAGTYQLDVPPGRHTFSFEDTEGYDDFEEPTATLPTWWGVSVERDITGPTTLNLTVPDTTPGFVTFVDAEGHPIPGTMSLHGSTVAADVPIGGGLSGRGWIGTDTISPDDHGAYRVPLFGPSDLSGFQYDYRPGAPWGDSRSVGMMRLSPGEHLVIASAARMASADPGAPRDLTVATYGTTLMPSWIQPEEDGGGTLTYIVTITDPAGESRRLTTPWTIASFAGLRPNTPYTLTVTAVNTHGTGPGVTLSAITGDAPPTTEDPSPANPPTSPTETGVGPATTGGRGYWALAGDGHVYNFGDAPALGHTAAGAVDLEPTPTGKGYWTLNRDGTIGAFGDATALGNVERKTLGQGEEPASLSATPTGRGYWVFTNRGRAVAFGDAPHLGDMSTVTLNGPVLGSVATPSGQGYYMVASDGGIFAFGDALFIGSMGATQLNAPVQSLVPDSDGKGYWLVASDGGIFAFDAPFRGSMGATRLNKPVVGMVRYGDGYLMVGADGGIFNFSTSPFAGSLGDRPPTAAVVAVAALP